MSVPISQFVLTKLHREKATGRWRVAGSGLYTYCPVVNISDETAESIIKAAAEASQLRADFIGPHGRVIQFEHGRNDLHKLLSESETAALVEALAAPMRSVEILQVIRRHSGGVSRANSFRALRNKRERV